MGERAAPPPCPVCRKPASPQGRWRPFCCERCKMVDLGRWFRGEYVVAGEDAIAIDPEELEEHLRHLAAERAREDDDADGDARGGVDGDA